MNIHALIPLLAIFAYIPLFSILLSSRPWQTRHRLFAAYLAAAVTWSLSDVLFRNDWLVPYKYLLLQVGITLFFLTCVQSHYFVASFYRTVSFKLPIAYGIPALALVLTVLGYIPESLTTVGGLRFSYGPWIYPLGLMLLALASADIYFLTRRFRVLADPEKRNQITYLVLGISILALFIAAGVTRFGREFPVAHMGNFTNAVILTFVTVRHRLLDVRFIARRGLVYGSMATLFLVTYTLWLFLVHHVLDVDYSFFSFLLVGVLTAVSAAGFWAKARLYLYRRIDELFYGESYNYRQDLVEFLERKAPVVSNLEEFGRELLMPLTKAIACSRAYLLLPETKTNDFSIQFAQAPEAMELSPRIRRDSPILKWLERENRYLSQESLEVLPEFRSLWSEEQNGFKSLGIELLFPLVSQGSLVAVLALGEKQSSKYTVEDVNLVETVAARVASSLEKEYLQEQLRKREKELALLNRLTGVISSSLDIREVYDAFVAELRQVVSADFVAITLIEGDELHFEALVSEGDSPWQPEERIPLEGTATQWVAKHKKALFEPDLARNRRFWTGEEYVRHGFRSIVYLPLLAKGEAIGSLILASRRPNAYAPEQIRLLEQLAAQVAVAVENSRLYARAEQRARIDELTSLFNRRHFDQCLRQEIDRHSRYSGMLSLIILDLDFFKAYNDKHGHLAGDKVLAQIGQLVNRSIRKTDLAFRYGGDEFAILLPQSTVDDALLVAERVRAKIASKMIQGQIRITASLGLACWPSDGVTPDEILTAADRALYYAKQTGGDRTCVASRMLPSLTEAATGSAVTEKEALSIIYALAATIEARDPYTYGHSRKVSSYAVALAEALGLPSEKVAIISTAALLHDIGKIGIPDEVLNKVGKLETEAIELIQSHPKLSATIVGHVLSLVSCLPAILHHHERWDGTGYPSGLKGEAIPIEARILAIADAFDAMTSERPYRGPLSYKKVIEELKRGAGTQFDPKLIEAFLPIALSTAPEELGIAEDYEEQESES